MSDYYKPVGKSVSDMQADNDAQWKPKQPAAEVGDSTDDKAVHQPRRATRRWRGSNWDGSTVEDGGATDVAK